MLWIGRYPASPSFCRRDSSDKAGADDQKIATVDMTNVENANVFLKNMRVLLRGPIRFPLCTLKTQQTLSWRRAFSVCAWDGTAFRESAPSRVRQPAREASREQTIFTYWRSCPWMPVPASISWLCTPQSSVTDGDDFCRARKPDSARAGDEPNFVHEHVRFSRSLDGCRRAPGPSSYSRTTAPPPSSKLIATDFVSV
jgi:hypothetical protein